MFLILTLNGGKRTCINFALVEYYQEHSSVEGVLTEIGINGHAKYVLESVASIDQMLNRTYSGVKGVS